MHAREGRVDLMGEMSLLTRPLLGDQLSLSTGFAPLGAASAQTTVTPEQVAAGSDH
jgi:hypothetical protein